MDEPFSVTLEVRDHECDLQGVVNNAVYQNYLEHARHRFLASRGVDFAQLAAQGVNLVLVRAELDYRKPLRPGDHFRVETSAHPEGRVRVVFAQRLVRADGAVMLEARMVGTAMDERGRPRIPAGLFERIAGPAS